MARILHNDEWYEEISSRGHYEIEFENVVGREAAHLFENYHMVPFKTIVFSEDDHDARQPDFALIHKRYRSWWVVEVELAHHSLEGHVLPQVRTFARAKYGTSEADYLCQRNSDLDRSMVIEMFKGRQPQVLVIVDSPVEGWADRLRPFRARVGICQIFRSRLDKYILRINGEYPSDDEAVLTTCECDLMLHRFLVIHAPAALPVEKGGQVLLYHEGKASKWVRIDTAGQVLLHALEGHSLTPGQQYNMVRHGDNKLVIEADSSQNT